MLFVFFFKQKTAYEMRISDWSSDVCSSDLQGRQQGRRSRTFRTGNGEPAVAAGGEVSLNHDDSQDAPQPKAKGKIATRRVARSLAMQALYQRSEERRVGKECVSTCRSRGSPTN